MPVRAPVRPLSLRRAAMRSNVEGREPSRRARPCDADPRSRERLAAVAEVARRPRRFRPQLGDERGVATLDERFEHVGRSPRARRHRTRDPRRGRAARAVAGARRRARAARARGAGRRGDAARDRAPARGPGRVGRRRAGRARPRRAAAPAAARCGWGVRHPRARRSPTAPVVVADRLAGVLLGAAIDDPTCGGRLRRVAPMALPFGRAEVVARIAGLSRRPTRRPAARGARAGRGARDRPRGGAWPALRRVRGARRRRARARRRAGRRARAARARHRPRRRARGGRPGAAGRPAGSAAGRGAVPRRAPDELPALEHVPVLAVAVGLPSRAERAAMWSAALGATTSRRRSASRTAWRSARISDGAWLAGATALAAGRGAIAPRDVEHGARAASVSGLGDLAIAMARRHRLGRPRAARAPARAAALARRVPASPRPRARRVGLRPPRRPRAGARRDVRRRLGHRQDARRARARRRARPRAVPRSTSRPSCRSGWGRPRRTSTASSPPRRARTPCCSSTRPTPSSAAAATSRTPTTATRTCRPRTCCRRMERHDGPVDARDEHARQHRRRLPAPDGRRRRVPVPDAEFRLRLWELLLPQEAPRGDDVDLDFLAERFELSGGGIRNAAIAAAVLAAQEGDGDRDGAARPRRRDGVREARPADARRRLRALPRPRAGRQRRAHDDDDDRRPGQHDDRRPRRGLRELLLAQLRRHGFDDIDVVFETPTSEWAGQLTRPTVNLFLCDLRKSTRPGQSGPDGGRDERPRDRAGAGAARGLHLRRDGVVEGRRRRAPPAVAGARRAVRVPDAQRPPRRRASTTARSASRSSRRSASSAPSSARTSGARSAASTSRRWTTS